MRRILIGLSFLALAGCMDGKPATEAPKPDATAAAGQTGALDPLVMSQKPARVASVRDVLAMKEGEKVVVSGKTLPDNCKPFNAAFASVLLMAPEDLDTPAIKEELSCDDAPTCPACKQILDAHSIRVELVDAAGAVVPASLEGFRGLKPGSTLTIEGEVKRDGKDKKLVRVVAKRFYPG